MKTEKWYHKKILCIPIWAVGFAVLITAAGYAQQQTLQLTTYYPAPYGEYSEMHVEKKLEILSAGKLQVTKGAGVSRLGLEVDLAKADPIQLSSFLDINNTNYGVDPSQVSIFKQVNPEKIKLGGTPLPLSDWPVLAYPNGSLLPSPVKMYFGTTTTGGKASVTVGGFFGFGTSSLPGGGGPAGGATSGYFVMISPRNIPSGQPPYHEHLTQLRIKNVGTYSVWSQTQRPASAPSYYKFTLAKTASSFTVTFEGSIPAEFDWIAIGN